MATSSLGKEEKLLLGEMIRIGPLMRLPRAKMPYITLARPSLEKFLDWRIENR